MNYNSSHGFTLIELMMVIAIIGILSAIAFPAYQAYTKRAHVTEGLTLANGAKVAIADHYSTFGSYPADNAAVGIMQATSINGQSVRSIAIAYSKVIITYNTKVQNGATVELQASIAGGAIKWTCTQGNVPASYRPSICR